MPTYISMCRWTAAGASKLKDSPKRLDAGRQSFAGSGVKILHFFMTMGKYDMVIIAEAPNDETLAKALLSLIGTGSITTSTTRAFTEDEYREILSSLP